MDLSNIQIESNFFGAHTMDALYNNTILFAKPENKSSWSIIGYHMKEYVTDTAGFRNLMINSSFPPNNNTYLTLRNTSNLTITYNFKIIKSSFNLLIYQIKDNTKILCQKYSELSHHCSIAPDNFTISCGILSSTFNILDSTYLLIVENGFVKESIYQEPLPGITGNLWIVKTEPVPRDLSESGTKYFINLTSESQQMYIIELSEKLVKSIPIDPSRLKFSGRFETDSSGQILFELSIYAKQNSQSNVTQIIDDLNTLFGNKQITNLADVDIDKHYPFTPRSNVFDEIKYFAIDTSIVQKAYVFGCKDHHKIYKALSDKNFDVGNDMEIYDGKNKFTNETSLYGNEDNNLKEAMLKEDKMDRIVL
ncbi:11535_t:CDS:2, partial [Racocetra persica]